MNVPWKRCRPSCPLRSVLFRHVAVLLAVVLANNAAAAGKYLEVSYPLPDMRFVDATASAKTKHEYRVISVNSAELRSESSKPSSVP